MRSQHLLILVMVGAGLGLFFSGFSTYDFTKHLDRQVHSVHCSFIPGLAAADATGSSGCQVAMMSPFSSVMRTETWAGIPIALPSMSVFAFLVFFALELHWSRRLEDRRALGFLVLATALPCVVSVLMGYIALATLGSLCKLCTGIYVGSFLSLGAAFFLWRRAPHRAFYDIMNDDDLEPVASKGEYSDGPVGIGDDGTGADVDGEVDATEPDRPSLSARRRPPVVSTTYLAGAFAAGVFFVALPVLAYVAAAPEHDAFITDCGVLNDPRDRYGVMVALDDGTGKVDVVEALDPLCPACSAFELRLERFARLGELKRRALLFPLDSTCNWMVDSPIHPGACTVSEAILCAKDRANEVLAWAFSEQDRIREESAKDPRAAKRIVVEAFPELRRCIGSATVRSKLNKSLRWAVANRLQILTPQFFVEGVKLCDEDLDLGLDYALGLLLDKHAAGELPKPPRRPIFVRKPVEPKDSGGGAGGGAGSETGEGTGGAPGADTQPGAEGADPTTAVAGGGTEPTEDVAGDEAGGSDDAEGADAPPTPSDDSPPVQPADPPTIPTPEPTPEPIGAPQ